MGKLVWLILWILFLLTSSSCGFATAPTERPELTFEEHQAMVPPAPTKIEITTETGKVLLSWQAAEPVLTDHLYSDTVLYYKVFRRTADELSPISLGKTSEQHYSDAQAKQGISYYYGQEADKIPGIMHSVIGGYYPDDIQF